MTPYLLHAAVDSLPILEELTTEALTAVISGSSITLLLLALLKFRCHRSGLLVKVNRWLSPRQSALRLISADWLVFACFSNSFCLNECKREVKAVSRS
jgi:hypothetical protein